MIGGLEDEETDACSWATLLFPHRVLSSSTGSLGALIGHRLRPVLSPVGRLALKGKALNALAVAGLDGGLTAHLKHLEIPAICR